MKDEFGRKIDYLRISLTDRCNFRCVYCMPEEGVEMMSHKDILSFEELLRIARIAADMGVSKVRLTGGEPLVRKGVTSFVRELSAINGIETISMTTNGFYLEEMAGELKENGLERLNISLDTINREKFHRLTRRDGLEKVLRGIDAAKDAGFSPIKINAVVLKGRNDDEILQLARFAQNKGLILRFIEQMPFNSNDMKNFISAEDIRKVLSRELGTPLKLEDQQKLVSIGNGPAELYRFGDNGPLVGFITPVSNHFCSGCNRLRITADGKLKPCLLSEAEIDIRTSLREGCSDTVLGNILRNAVGCKPEKHKLNESGVESKRGMSKIGG